MKTSGIFAMLNTPNTYDPSQEPLLEEYSVAAHVSRSPAPASRYLLTRHDLFVRVCIFLVDIQVSTKLSGRACQKLRDPERIRDGDQAALARTKVVLARRRGKRHQQGKLFLERKCALGCLLVDIVWAI